MAGRAQGAVTPTNPVRDDWRSPCLFETWRRGSGVVPNSRLPCGVPSAPAPGVCTMIIPPAFRRACLTALMFAGLSSTAAAQTAAVSPGALRTYSTIYSIGVEWDLTNDTDHDASCGRGIPRLSGTTAWRRALPLVRVDFNGSNMLAGSLMFLAPGHELRRAAVAGRSRRRRRDARSSASGRAPCRVRPPRAGSSMSCPELAAATDRRRRRSAASRRPRASRSRATRSCCTPARTAAGSGSPRAARRRATSPGGRPATARC